MDASLIKKRYLSDVTNIFGILLTIVTISLYLNQTYLSTPLGLTCLSFKALMVIGFAANRLVCVVDCKYLNCVRY